MGFDVFDKINKAGQATETYLRKRWEFRHVSEAERRRIEERNRFLALVAAKVTGSSMIEMPPLACSYNADQDPANSATGSANSKAVFLATLPIAFGPFELSRNTYKLLARHLGMSLNSVSHWALCVIDREPAGISYCYDLMSDQLALNALGRNYFRVAEITPEFIETWTTCYYVGETTKSHEVIQQLGLNFMAIHPRYNLLTNNCQTLVENLVKLLCDGKVISQPMLNEELSLISPKIARDIMVAKLRSKLDKSNEDEEREDVKEDVDIIKAWFHKIQHH